MDSELHQILKTFYKKLHHNILREEKKLRNDSVLWTLMELKSKKVEKILGDSFIIPTYFDREKFNTLLNEGFIRQNEPIPSNEYILTSKGIWEIEKLEKSVSEETLLKFIEEKYLTFSSKLKPIDDKEKIAIFSLICMRNFSNESPMDLNTEKYRDGWLKIFEEVFNFMNSNGIFNEKHKSLNDILSSKGSEHPVQSLMRHRNDLPIKSGQIFMNPGSSKYWLDIYTNNALNINNLIKAFRMVFKTIDDIERKSMIGSFCNRIANDYAKYVKRDFKFIDSNTDEVIVKALNELYLS